MGSIREGADAVEPKAAPAAPALPAVPGTPVVGEHMDAGDGSSLPALDGVKQPPSPSQRAATTLPATPKGDEVMDVDATAPGERLTKKQKLEQTQDAVLELTNLVKVILDGLSGLHETLTQNT